MTEYNEREPIRKRGYIMNFQTKKLQEIRDDKMVNYRYAEIL
jgi:hypothetical protein